MLGCPGAFLKGRQELRRHASSCLPDFSPDLQYVEGALTVPICGVQSCSSCKLPAAGEMFIPLRNLSSQHGRVQQLSASVCLSTGLGYSSQRGLIPPQTKNNRCLLTRWLLGLRGLYGVHPAQQLQSRPLLA